MILTAIFALSAAAAWGSGDFTGGIASRRSSPFHTIFISYTVGMFALLLVALVNQERMSSAPDLLWGAVAGLSGLVGLIFLFRGFAAGRMGIVAPISASLATAIPVVFTAITEGLPRLLQLLGFGLAVTGIWLLSRPESLSSRPAGIGLAMLAGLGFGGFFTALNQVSDGAIFWPLVSGRLACLVAMMIFALTTRKTLFVPRSPIGIMVLAGLLDASGNLFFLLAVQSGRLDVATVLGSLYPAVTTFLAWLIAREHMARLQMLGVAVAVLAIVLITV